MNRYNQEEKILGSIFTTNLEEKARGHWACRLLRRYYSSTLLCLDVAIIVAIFAGLVKFYYDVELLTSVSRRVMLAIIVPSVLSVWITGGYNYNVRKTSERFIAEHIIASIAALVIGFTIIYSVIAYGVNMHSSRLLVASTFAIFPVVSIFYRYILGHSQSKLERENLFVIVGAGTRALDLYTKMSQRGDKYKIRVKTFDEEKVGKHIDPDDCSSPVIERMNDLNFPSMVDGMLVEQYVISLNEYKLPKLLQRQLVAAIFRSSNVVSYRKFVSDKLKIEPPSQIDINWPSMEGFRLNRSFVYDRVKRSMDILAALVGFVLASPFLLITAIAVKMTSPGPIIFKQERVGYQEKPFMILKFRSMSVGSEKGDKYTAKNDSRLTPIGSFIRKTRLDELPQLWNVLRGDLSLIGPRAEWKELVDGYEDRLPFYHFRHAVKPGITGWAQVNYSYGANDDDTLAKLNYDLYYVRRYSLSLDITIVVKTIYMMLFGKGM
ncbi:MAG: sugar transferase [Patiriisocius sp.]|uniref:sugar transferase n=1 Tax=Patiriisocius sp. TaxID=2822396 RepID=UPI003EF317E3